MSLARDLKLLGLASAAGLTPASVKEAFRERSRTLHPDAGTDDAGAFNEAREARDRLLAYLVKPKRCPACRGEGKVNLAKGFRSLRVRCSACGGKGTVVGGLAAAATMPATTEEPEHAAPIVTPPPPTEEEPS